MAANLASHPVNYIVAFDTVLPGHYNPAVEQPSRNNIAQHERETFPTTGGESAGSCAFKLEAEYSSKCDKLYLRSAQHLWSLLTGEHSVFELLFLFGLVFKSLVCFQCQSGGGKKDTRRRCDSVACLGLLIEHLVANGERLLLTVS